MLHLAGFEGPLDLLLELARQQKLDLATISIADLVDQFLAVIEGARRVRLELAADWLVMAAWLAWLKSRLLLPPGEAGGEAALEAEHQAERLAARLRDLARVRELAEWLQAQPVLGHDVFERGAPETLVETDRSQFAFDVTGLLRAYLSARRRTMGEATYVPPPAALWSVQQALDRLRTLLGSLPSGCDLMAFLPTHAGSALERRGAISATLIAGLELARDGHVALRQDQPFGAILLDVQGSAS